MKVYMHPPNESWICDIFTDEFRKYCSDISTNNPYEADIIWLIADWCWNQLPINLLTNKKVVTTTFHIVPEKFDSRARHDFMKLDSVTNLFHTSCKKTADFLKEIGIKKEIWVEPTWVNQEIWKKLKDKEKIRKDFGFRASDFVIGSFQRDTEGSDLKSPKLEKGPDIFCDYIEEIAKEKDITVLLGGWRRQYVINRLEKANIKYVYKELPDYETLNKMYNCLDLYVVGSRYEGGPQSIVESALIEIPIISTDLGIAEYILSEESISKEISAKSLLECKPNILVARKNVEKFLIPKGFDSFVKKLEELI